jgi:hypothetical protein
MYEIVRCIAIVRCIEIVWFRILVILDLLCIL